MENVIARLKTMKVINSVHRHRRDKFGKLVELCASLCKRRTDMYDSV